MKNTIEIKEVESKADLRKFVDYPNILYRDDERFVPAFYGDDLADWDKEKNPAFEYCEARAFLAYRNGEIVGRIGAILSRKSNEIWNTNRMRFTQVDFIDDPEVSKKLFETVENWAREKDCSQVHGPLGFCDMDREGMLVDGFDRRSMFITYYNHPYYIDHLSSLGYSKDVDWVEYKIPVPKKGDEFYRKVHKIAGRILEKGSYSVVDISRKSKVKPYVKKVFQLLNEAYADLYSVVDLNERQIDKYVDKFLPLINKDYICIIVDKNDEVVAFGVSAPSMASAMQKSRGRLFPTGWIGVLKSLRKNTVVDLLLIAVKPELQKTGLNAVVLDHIMMSCIKNGIEYAESGPMLELNVKVLSQWKMFKLEPHKRRRCFIKDI
ncbi:MAG: hypothetical protein ACOX71_06625 [Lachnospiraceae bacterium]|jgi:hypothetical protein